jgi:hypothetical protein
VGKQRLLRRGITVLVLAWFALSIAMIFFVPGWGTTPLDKLPAVFWIMYITVATGWFILDVADILRPTVLSKNARTSILDMLLLVTGVIMVGVNLFAPEWTGGRLFQLTVGGLLLIQSVNHLIQAQIAKRRQTA